MKNIAFYIKNVIMDLKLSYYEIIYIFVQLTFLLKIYLFLSSVN